MYRTAENIADYIITISIKSGNPVNNLKLQKLLYYTQAAFLVEGKECFEEDLYWYRYGPTMPEVLKKFGYYGNEPIKYHKCNNPTLTKEEQRLIEEVVYSYKDYSAMDLIRKVLQEDPRELGFTRIRKQEIKNYYTNHKDLIYGNYRF